MQEILSNRKNKPTIQLLTTEDVKNLLYVAKTDLQQKENSFKNPYAIAEKFMKKYGIKIGDEYFIEKGRFLEIVRQTGELNLEEE